MDEWVFRLVEGGGAAGIFLLMLLETVFPPIPSEVIMPVAGVVAARGELSLVSVIIAGTAGAMAGNLFWYLVARMIGLERFRPFIERHGRWLTLDWPEVERAQRLFGRFGAAIVGFGRIIPTIRSVVSLPAGLIRMRLPGFLLWSTIGTVVWSSGLAIAGWVLGRQFDQIERFIGPLSTAVIVLIVTTYVWRQLTWNRRRRRSGDS
ncbi:DedA family protein [Croceibacterium ferulae]|uniref:DedA family protein n=1 Tax=Croceibacterium ferulae TaxID=1854641 RepID=UPI000EB03144|nr:DedA family protein [Croceibacterium ferulae]